MIFKAYQYLFYRLFRYAQKTERNWGNSAMPQWVALFSVSMLLFLNLGILLFVLDLFFNIELELSKVFVFSFAVLVYIINHFLFLKDKKYLEIVEHYSKETPTKATIRTILVWIYLITTFVLMYMVLPQMKHG